MSIWSWIAKKAVGESAVTLVDTIDKIVDKYTESPDEKRTFREVINRAQTEINKIEAGHRSLFVAGWRPAIGWTCAIGVFWIFIGEPVLQYILIASGIPIPPPHLDAEQLIKLTYALLGIGGTSIIVRTIEKKMGVNGR